MMIIVTVLLLVCYVGLVFLTLKKSIIEGRMEYILYYLVTFLPFYVTFQSLVYQSTNSELLVRLIQYSKELVFFTFILFWVFSKRNIFKVKWEIGQLDFLFILFLSLSLIYAIAPIGEATFVSKAIYFKNILLMCLMYFLGRNSYFSFRIWNHVFSILFALTVLAFVIVLFEKISSTHLHSILGYANYNQEINNIEPQGNYGLTWTFQTSSGQKRFGSFFANPLDFSASMLISFSASVIFLLSVPYNTNRVKYLGLLFFSSACVVLAYSRASFVAFFLMLFFMAFVLKLYRLIFIACMLVLMLILYLIFLAPLETQHFILDTLIFRNSSSFGHLIEWIEAVESMIQNPMGIGLATSGNAGGVESDLKVGGENQFLIFGVQLGILGFIIYIGMLFLAIRDSWRAFRLAPKRTWQIVPFIAATVKFGLLLPLFTSNVETYLYVSFFSWWMVGYSIREYKHQLNLSNA